MSRAVLATLAFIAGGIAASLGCIALHDAAAKKVRSEITHPTGHLLSNISQDIRHGRTDLAVRKMFALDQRYRDFLAGGRPPELFAGEVVAVADLETTR